MRRSLHIFALILASLSVVAGCSSPARGYCEASADCDLEFLGIAIDDASDADDAVAVCTAQQDAQTAALRANEEEECLAVADARDAYHACVGAEFNGGADGCDAVAEDCANEFDDLQDAKQEVNGDECSSSET
jgi:hypothetical protein